MSIHDSESSRVNKIESDNNSETLPMQDQGVKERAAGQFIDPDMDMDIIYSIKSQLPALIEFSRLGYQKDNITVPELSVLQDKIEQSIRKQDKSTLPAEVKKMIAQIKGAEEINKFSSFIREFIKYKQENYKYNSSPEAALLHAKIKENNMQVSIDKRNDKLNFLASRLTNSLSESFTIIESLSQYKPEFWLSWNKFVEREREAFYNANANMTGEEQPAEAFRKGKLRVELQKNDPFELMKVNSLINTQLLEEKKRRENVLGLTASTVGAIDVPDAEATGELTNDLSRFGLNKSSGIVSSIKALIQSVKLTEKDAFEFFVSPQATKLTEHGYAFCELIISTCQKLHPILVELEVELRKVQPSTQALQDSEPEGIKELLHGVGKKIIAPNKKNSNSFKESLPLTPRFIEASTLKFERKLTGIISFKAKVFSPAEIAAILYTGLIVKDKLQQTLVNMAQMNQASATLRFALERFDAVNWLLKKNSDLSGNIFLVKELEANKDFWERAVIEEKMKLAKLIDSKMDLSEGQGKALLLLKMSDILMSDTHTVNSQQEINAYYIELVNFIEYVFTSEQRMKTIPDKLCNYPSERRKGEGEIKNWMRELQATRSYLNIEMTDVTGWAPASFSRTGMLAKGIAESHQERKITWLKQRYGDKFTQSQEEAYDAAFLRFFKNYLPFVAREKEGSGELLMRRIEIEMKNAAEGKVSYPGTMAEILSAQKSNDAAFRSWSIRRLIKKSLNASLSSFTLMPSFASLPLRIAIKCLITGAVVTFVIDKGGKAVRLGEGSSKLEGSKYRKNAFKQLAIKIGVGTFPLAYNIIGGVFLWEDFYKGNAKDAAKNMAKEMASELPFMALNRVVNNSINAVKERKIAEQEQLLDFFKKTIKMARENDENSETEKPVTKVKTLNVRDELYRISQGGNSEQAKLAHSLLNNRSIDSFKLTQSEGYVFSQYKMQTREIQLSEGATDEEVLHEIVHALSAHQVASGVAYPDSDLGVKVKQLDALRERALKAYQKRGGTDLTMLYFLSRPEEFIAGLYSGDSEFTDFLNSIDVNGRSLLWRMLDLLYLLLGIETEQESALTHALGLSDAIMATPVPEEMEGEQQNHEFFRQVNRAANATSISTRDVMGNVVTRSLPLGATTIPNTSVRNALVAELAAMPRYDRDEWIKNSRLPADTKRDLGIYLAENHYIYDRMVTGSDYFAWVQSFHRRWPSDFQSENRIVGVLRLPSSVLAGDFPTGKGFKLVLKNSHGKVIFEKVYYPRVNSEKKGAWKTDIASQIDEDMLLLEDNNRIHFGHIHRYEYSNPEVISGSSNTEQNVFFTDANSEVKSVDFQIVSQDSSLSIHSLSTSAEGVALAERLAKMSATEREVWLQRSKLHPYLKRNLSIYLAENYYIYDNMVKGSDYFKYVQGRNKKWPKDFQSKNRIVGVLRLPDSVLAGDFPAGKGFKLELKNSSGEIIFEKIYYPRPGSISSGAWKADISSQIDEDMLRLDEEDRISVSHINDAESSAPEVVSGSSDDNLNVFVVNENSQVESANFQFVDQNCTLSLKEITSREEFSSLTSLLAIMSPAKRKVWFNESKLPDDDKTRLRIFLSEEYYIYDSMVTGSEYFAAISDVMSQWPDDIQSKNRIVGVLHQGTNKSREDFPAGKGFKFTLKNSAGKVVFEKTYYPLAGHESSDKWKPSVLSQIEADMLLQDDSNRISVSHILNPTSSNAEVVSGSSNDGLNVFVIDEKSQVENANFEFVDKEGTVRESTSASSDTSASASVATSVFKPLSANDQLDNTLLKSAASQGMVFTRADLDKEYTVNFERTKNYTFGAASYIPPTTSLDTRTYKLRDILAGNIYRSEDSKLDSISNFHSVVGIPGLTQDVLHEIINHAEKSIKTKIEALRSSSLLRSAVKNSYQESIDSALVKFLSTPKNDDVVALVKDYFSGKAQLRTVSVNMPWEVLGLSVSDSSYPVPEMVAITKGDLKIVVSLKSGKCYIVRGGMVPGREFAIDIQNCLSLKDRDAIIPGYKPWLSWSLSYGDATNDIQTLLNRLYDGLIDRLSSDLDYDVFTPNEHKTQRLVNFGKGALSTIAISTGILAALSSGNIQAALLLVGMAAEAGDIGLSILKLNNSDRGEEYNEAKADILVASILFVVFSAPDVRSLLRYAVGNTKEFISVTRKAREFVNKIKQSPDAATNLSKGISDANVRTDYSRQVLDEGVIDGTITEGRHHELMAGVDAQHSTPSSSSPSEGSSIRSASSDGESSALNSSTNTGGTTSTSNNSHMPDQKSSSGYQSGNSTSQNASLRETQTPSPASEGSSISDSHSSGSGNNVNSGVQHKMNPTVPDPMPLPGVRGIEEGRKPFTKNEVAHNNKNYGYRQYDDYRIYMPEGKDARPDRFLLTGHGGTIGTKTVACPKNTTINFYGEHGKLLDDPGLTSAKMQPVARVRYNELGEPVTEVPIMQNGRIAGWRNATLKERIRFTGTSQPGKYKDIKLSYYENDNPYGAMDLWELEKNASAQNPTFAPATPRPGGLITIGEKKTPKLSTVIEDMASVSGTGQAEVDVLACRGGWLATLLANRNMRARPSTRYAGRRGHRLSDNKAVPSSRYSEQSRIRSGFRPSENRTGDPHRLKKDFENTLSPLATGGREIFGEALRHPKTTLKLLGYSSVIVIEASLFGMWILYLRGDFDSPEATTNRESVGTEPATSPSTGEQNRTLTKDEVSKRLDFFTEKVRSFSTVLSTYDDDALAKLRPLEKQYFGDDDYLDVQDLTQILAFIEAIKNDDSGESLKAFLEGTATPWEIENPNNPFARLGRENVMGFLEDVLR